MIHPPQLLLLGCFRFSFSTCWLSRCLAAAPLAQLFAAAAAGVTVAVLLAICHLHSVVDAGACTVIVLCAVTVAELSAAAADGGTVAVLFSNYMFLLSVAGACSCTVFFCPLVFLRRIARDGTGLGIWAEPACRSPTSCPSRALPGSASLLIFV